MAGYHPRDLKRTLPWLAIVFALEHRETPGIIVIDDDEERGAVLAAYKVLRVFATAFGQGDCLPVFVYVAACLVLE